MSYQIGQLRDSDLSPSSYFTPIAVKQQRDIMITSSILDADLDFYEVGISSNDSSWMQSQKNYYLNFTVERYSQNYFKDADPTVNTIDFVLCLLVDGSSPGEYTIGQILAEYSVLPYPPDDTNPDNKKANYEVIFTPFRDDIARIGFIRKKKKYDYISSGPERILNLTVNKYGQIKNLLPQIVGANNRSASKIGIQAKPGFLVCVNGESIRVGKSGIYEIHNGIPIFFLGMAAAEEHFLIDCAWEG